jgi:hypothetical protein
MTVHVNVQDDVTRPKFDASAWELVPDRHDFEAPAGLMSGLSSRDALRGATKQRSEFVTPFERQQIADAESSTAVVNKDWDDLALFEKPRLPLPDVLARGGQSGSAFLPGFDWKCKVRSYNASACRTVVYIQVIVKIVT